MHLAVAPVRVAEEAGDASLDEEVEQSETQHRELQNHRERPRKQHPDLKQNVKFIN